MDDLLVSLTTVLRRYGRRSVVVEHWDSSGWLSRRQGDAPAVSSDNVVGLVLAATLIVFLVVALLFPERF